MYKTPASRSSGFFWPFSSQTNLADKGPTSSSVCLPSSPNPLARMDSCTPLDPRERERQIRRTIVLRDYHDQPFSERNYGAIRGLFETPTRKIIRHEGIAFLGEFIGTFSFLYMAFMVAQIISTHRPNVKVDPEFVDKAALVMVAFGFGMGLMVNVFIWFRVSGGQFNPAGEFAILLFPRSCLWREPGS